jgi:hypothetical protein
MKEKINVYLRSSFIIQFLLLHFGAQGFHKAPAMDSVVFQIINMKFISRSLSLVEGRGGC